MDVLRSIGKQSRESVESVLKKKRKDLPKRKVLSYKTRYKTSETSEKKVAGNLAGVVPEDWRHADVTQRLKLSRTSLAIAAFVLKVQLLSQRALHVLPAYMSMSMSTVDLHSA